MWYIIIWCIFGPTIIGLFIFSYYSIEEIAEKEKQNGRKIRKIKK